MKRLFLLRHAKSSWKDPALTDHDRPLNKRGRRDAPRMGKLLSDEDLVPDLILSSTALRARTTAELAAEACGYSGPLELSEDLYHADVPTFLAVLQDLFYDDTSVLIVSHNPGISEFLYALTGQSEEMPTASLALVELDIESWWQLDSTTKGKLIRVWRPRELIED